MSLLDRLKAVGEYDSTGQFTLDEEQARRKLARFQLTDSRRFVLELVMAAVSLGVRRLEVFTHPDLLLTWTGPAFSACALADLERFLLEGPGPERHLAVALNALQGLKPRRVTVTSPDGLQLVNGEAQRGSFPASSVRVEGLGNLSELAELLERECGLGPAQVNLNSTPLVEQVRWLGPPVTGNGPGLRVEVGLHPTLASSELILVHHGVAVARHQPQLELPLRAVVHGDDFTLNASHSDVVQDEALDRAVALVEETGRLCLTGTIARFSPDGPPQLTTFLRSRPQGRGSAWWRLPLFPLADGRLASAQQLQDQCDALGLVPVVSQAPSGAPADLLLVRANPEVEAILKRLFGGRVGPGEAHALTRLRADANRQAWERQPAEPVLKLGRYLVQTSVTGPHFSGQLGLEAQDGSRSAVLEVLYQGRRLSTESLEAPLPYVAVLDFTELEVRADWSGPAAGTLYSQALAQLDEEAERLYLQLSETDVEGAWPGVREALLALLSSPRKGGRGKSFRQARLFALATGGALSLAALEEAAGRGEPLWLLPRGAQLPQVPREAMPAGMILLGGAPAEAVLQRTLGKKVKALGTRQLQDLTELGQRLGRKQPARLDPRPAGKVVRLDGLEGELVLLPEFGSGRLQVLRQGVALGGPRQVPALLCAFQAIVDGPRLTPQPDWRGPLADEAWSEVQDAVARAERRALEVLAADPPADCAWNPVLLRLLAQRPDSHVAGRALFPARPEPVSLNHVRAEQAARGRVLGAEARELRTLQLSLSETFVLDEGSRTLLERLVPGLVWESCGRRLQERQAEQEFLARPPVAAVRVGGSVKLRLGLKAPLTGEVALGGGGEVSLYHLNRPLGKVRWLPAGLQGAVQSQDFRPTADFLDVERDEACRSARDAILESASRLIGKAAREGVTLPLLTWVALADWEGLQDEDRELVRRHPFLPRAGGGKLTLAELGDEGRYLNHLVGQAPLGPVLLLKAEEVGPVSRLVALKNYFYEHQRLLQLQERHQRLRRLSLTLPPCFAEADFRQASLRGVIGIPRRPRHEVVLVQEGGPVAWYEPSVPLAGVLEGNWELHRLEERAQLGKEQRRRLEQAARELYEELARRFDPAHHRDAILEYLRTEWRTVRDSPVARLPVFRCWKGMASLEALLEEARTEGELVCIERGVDPPAVDSRLYPLVESELLPAIFGNKLRLLRRARLTEGLGVALKSAGVGVGTGLVNVTRAVLDPGWQGLVWVASGVTGILERLAGALPAGPAAAETPAEVLPEGRPRSPEERLLASLRRHFNLSVQNPARKHSREIIEKLRLARYILGPPSWWDSHGLLCLNVNHSSIRYALTHQDDDPAVVQMLLVHVFCAINQRLEEVTDDHEEEFLRDLGRTLALAYGAGGDA